MTLERECKQKRDFSASAVVLVKSLVSQSSKSFSFHSQGIPSDKTTEDEEENRIRIILQGGEETPKSRPEKYITGIS